MKRTPLTYLDWNGPYREPTISNPQAHYALFRTTNRKLPLWECAVILLAVVLTLACLVWAKV